MVKTGPQKYPGANLNYWYQGTYGGSAMESNVGVIHTTEGMTVPTYGGGASAPNFTALPDIRNRVLRWYQHFDFDVSSRALVNRAGGVETNTANAVQIELVGTCDPAHRTSWGDKTAGVHYLYWPDAPDWALAELAKFVRWAHDEHGVRLSSTVTWKAYPASYGANGVRLTGAQWTAYYGWLGHQHVPENDHGDPGDLDFARVLAHATGTTTPQEEDVALTKADVKTLFTTDGVIPVPAAWSPGNDYWTAASLMVDQGKRLRALQKEVGVLAAANAKLVDAVAVLAAGLGELDPAAIITELKAAIESIDIRLDVPDSP